MLEREKRPGLVNPWACRTVSGGVSSDGDFLQACAWFAIDRIGKEKRRE